MAGVGEGDDESEHGAQAQHLGGQLDGLLRRTRHRVGAGLEGVHVGPGGVQPQLVQVVLEHSEQGTETVLWQREQAALLYTCLCIKTEFSRSRKVWSTNSLVFFGIFN